MTIEQTIEIPANRRIFLDLPPELPVGKARISVTPVVEMPNTNMSLLSLQGSCKGLDTMDAYFARKRADKLLEDRKNGPGSENT